jgi:hypothetical protein
MPRLLAVLALVAGLACSAALAGKAQKKLKTEPTPVGAVGAQMPGVPKQPKAPTDALLLATDEILRQVSALRGLPAKAPLQRGVLSRQAIGAKLKERIAKEYTPDEVRAEGRVLVRLGLLPPKTDYEKLVLDLLMEQVAGFYDPYAKKLYIADWLPLEMQRPALAHEIQHALQDQYYDLKRFSTPIKDNGDRQLAQAALVEGDGTVVMLEFQAQAMGLPVDQLPDLVTTLGRQLIEGGGMADRAPLFARAPLFLKQTLIFPYLNGLTFVAALRRGRPWSEMDKVWKRPPVSTEQVLHPEKYEAEEAPIAVTAAPLPALGAWKELRQDVLGELTFRILFASRLPAEVAEKAAAGWGGDRLAAYVDPASPERPATVVILSVWDGETDAREAESAARKWAAAGAGKPEAEGLLTDPNGDEWLIERKGERLLLVCGAPAGKAQAVAAEAWQGWKVAR